MKNPVSSGTQHIRKAIMPVGAQHDQIRLFPFGDPQDFLLRPTDDHDAFGQGNVSGFQ